MVFRPRRCGRIPLLGRRPLDRRPYRRTPNIQPILLSPHQRPVPLLDVDLADWFREHGRDLPWRHSRDPWEILVAEVMLQQTQVERVSTRWVRFLERFPTANVTARSSIGEVIDEWSGLGYNRRAVNLHRCAVAIAEHHRGRFPRELSELEALPGIGPYTSRAIRVFAFEQAESVLDTNVARILARTAGKSLRRAEAQALADASRTGDPWVWNQAMLDVGAGHCRPVPDCAGCPFVSACSWAEVGWVEPDPAVGSAGVSGRQSRFEGSDRQGRGRLVRALRKGPIERSDVASVAGWPNDQTRAEAAVQTLLRDGLAVEAADGSLILP